MKNSTCASLIILAGVLAPLFAVAQLKLVQQAEIPGNYTGKFDHFAVDLKHGRLYATPESAQAIEVLTVFSSS